MHHRSETSLTWTFIAVLTLLLVAIGLWLTGCGESTVRSGLPYEGRTGMAVGSAALTDTEVAKIEFVVFTHTGGKEVGRAVRRLSASRLPGGLSTEALSRLDDRSSHRFADNYFVLPAGERYDVKAIPRRADGSRFEECDAAWAKGKRVDDGRTREVLLFNQCRGEQPGGADAIAALNHNPRVENVAFYPSKFVRCGQRVAVCMTASDKDHDPLRVRWQLEGTSRQPKRVPADWFDSCRRHCQKKGAGGYHCIGRCLHYRRVKRRKLCDHRCQKTCKNRGIHPSGEADGDHRRHGRYRRCHDRCLRQNRGELRQCAIFRADPGLKGVGLTVWDRIWHRTTDDDPYNDQLIDFETYFRHRGQPRKSRDAAAFPMEVEGRCSATVAADAGE